MGAARVADRGGGKSVPLHAGAQHQQDGVHHPAVGDARTVTAQRVRRRRRQQRLDLLPQPVWHAPAVVALDESHENLLQGRSRGSFRKEIRRCSRDAYRDRSLGSTPLQRLNRDLIGAHYAWLLAEGRVLKKPRDFKERQKAKAEAKAKAAVSYTHLTLPT